MSQTGVAAPPKGHIDVLDGVRAASILLVLAAHLLPLGPKSWLLNGIAAGCGMSLFFVLSGFLITRLLLDDNNLVNFLVKRLTRILPLAWLYCVLVFVLFDHDIQRLILNVTFALNFDYGVSGPYDGQLWSLCLEVQFYLVIGVAFRLLGERAKWVVLGLCLLFTALRVAADAPYSTLTQLRGDEILTGALLCISTSGRFGDHSRFWGLVGRVTPVFVPLLMVTSIPEGGWLSCLRAYPAALLVGSVMYSRATWLKALLTSKPAVYIAKISYALYIFHPAAAAGPLALGDGPKWLLYLVKRPITFAISFGLAHVSTFHFERIWTARGRRWVEGRHSARRAIARALALPAQRA